MPKPARKSTKPVVEPVQLPLPTVEVKAEPLVVNKKPLAKAKSSRHRPPMPTKKVYERVIARAVKNGTVPSDSIAAPKVITQDSPAPVPAQPAHVYQVFRDINGVTYLRVAAGKKQGDVQFIVNKGFEVALITVAPQHWGASGLNLTAVPGASILESAKRLLHPLNDQVTIQQRAIAHLTSILNNKELTMKETAKSAKPAKFATVTAPAPNKAAAAKATPAKAAKAAPATKPVAAKGNPKFAEGAAERASKAAAMTVKLVKSPADGELGKQPTAIMGVLKSLKGKATVATLIEAMEKVIVTANVLGVKDVWAMNRKQLIDKGYITVTE